MFHVYSEAIAIRWSPFLLAIGQVLVLHVNRTPQSLSQAGNSGNSPSISQEKGPSPTDFQWHFLISCNSLATMARWWIYAKVPWPEHGWWWRAMCPRTFLYDFICVLSTLVVGGSPRVLISRRLRMPCLWGFSRNIFCGVGTFAPSKSWVRTSGTLKPHTFYICPHEDIATIAYNGHYLLE